MKHLRHTVVAVAAGASIALAVPASASAACVLTAPGTVTRPILTAAEAEPYQPGNYLGWSGLYSAPTRDPWHPGDINLRGVRPDFVVGPATAPGVTQTTVQTAVNAAVLAGGTTRRYIKVLPGTYTGAVLIPAGTAPLTVYGGGPVGDVRIELSLDATISPAAWAQQVNPSGQYVDGDPAWAMYQSCATRTSAAVGTCASVVWSQNVGFQLRGLTITNTLLDTVDRGTHQALALRTDADRTELDGVRLVSRQDTFYANAGAADRIARVSVRDSYIEGDTDFVFGRASALFEHSEFHLVSSRKASGGVVFAPSTLPAYRFGFLVRQCRITADAGYLAAPTGFLGRAWDQGAGATGYLPGTSPNGQLVIRDSYLGPGFNPVTPWAPAATTARPFAAPIEPGRALDDPTHNRLWEYRNVQDNS